MKNQNKKIIITITGAILLNVFAFWLWFFLFSQINEKIESVNSLRGQIKANETITATYKKMAVGANSFTDKQKELDLVFVNRDGIVGFIEKLEEISSLSSVVFELISAEEKKDSKSNPTFRFDVKGSFNNVYKFLGLIENMPFEIAVDNFAIQKEGEAGGGLWKANFNITLISFSDK